MWQSQDQIPGPCDIKTQSFLCVRLRGLRKSMALDNKEAILEGKILDLGGKGKRALLVLKTKIN